MKKLIRIFSYILMILGGLILLGGLATGIFMLIARGARMMEHSFPMVRMMGSGSAVMTGLGAMLKGVLVSGFGMLLYLAGDIAQPKTAPKLEAPVKAVKAKKVTKTK
jgi:hypothetical protein